MRNFSVAYAGLTIFALTAGPVGAQDVIYQSFSSVEQGGVAALGPAPPDRIGVIALDPMNVGRPVLNAPYSAEAVTEMTQVLADGNRIEQRTSATIARDSRGRVRREQQAIAVGSFVTQNTQPIVTVTDPEGVHLLLDYNQKVAYRSRLPHLDFVEKGGAPKTAVAFGAARMAPRPPDAVTTFEMPVPPPPMAAMTNTVLAMPREGDYRRETLEPRSIEGLKAEGTRTTVTIPAGAMGNSHPIEIVSEQWYSPELQIVLLTRRSDPRFGETVYRLTNIDRSEPAPELFAVPADFKVEDMDRKFMKRVRPEPK